MPSESTDGTFSTLPFSFIRTSSELGQRKASKAAFVIQFVKLAPLFKLSLFIFFGRLRFGFVSYHLFKQLFNLEARSGALSELKFNSTS